MLKLPMESELCYIGVPAKLAPASPHGLTQTPHKLAWTPSDSMPFHIGMVWNMWGRVKTSIIDVTVEFPSKNSAGNI